MCDLIHDPIDEQAIHAPTGRLAGKLYVAPAGLIEDLDAPKVGELEAVAEQGIFVGFYLPEGDDE